MTTPYQALSPVSILNSVQKWCVSNRLKINESKSKVLLFASSQKLGTIDFSTQLLLGNSRLKYCDKYKYLGVTLDSEMTLTSLLADTKKIVSNRLFNLRKLRHYITEKAAVSIYKQTILPVLTTPVLLLSLVISRTDMNCKYYKMMLFELVLMLNAVINSLLLLCTSERIY